MLKKVVSKMRNKIISKKYKQNNKMNTIITNAHNLSELFKWDSLLDRLLFDDAYLELKNCK